MATLPIKPLDGADGYLRWKESVLLRLHTHGVAHVLSDEPPPAPAEGAGAAAAAKQWARDDAVCRGHILYTLSKRILPDYSRHGTARAVWQAVTRTYDLDRPSRSYSRQYEIFLHRFRFDVGPCASSSFLEQLAHAEALAATRDPPLDDYGMASMICDKLPAEMVAVITCGEMSMDTICKYAWIREMHIQLDDIMERSGEAEAAARVVQEPGRKTTGGRRHRRR